MKTITTNKIPIKLAQNLEHSLHSTPSLLNPKANPVCFWFLLIFQLPGLTGPRALTRQRSTFITKLSLLPVCRGKYCWVLLIHYSWWSQGEALLWMDHLYQPTNPIGQKSNNSITSYIFIFTLQESVKTEFDLHHDYTYTQLGLHDLLRSWRAVLDVYSREPGKYRYGIITMQ